MLKYSTYQNTMSMNTIVYAGALKLISFRKNYVLRAAIVLHFCSVGILKSLMALVACAVVAKEYRHKRFSLLYGNSVSSLQQTVSHVEPVGVTFYL